MTAITINGITVDHESIEDEGPQQPARALFAAAIGGTQPPPHRAYFLVNTAQPLTRAQREQLVRLGAELLESVAKNTLLVHCLAATVPLLRALDFVAWVVPYSIEFKIHAQLRQAVETVRSLRGALAAPQDSQATTHEVD